MKKNTIFIQIASYRDPELVNTIEDCIKNSKYPDNLKFCIAWQHSLDDKWDTLEPFVDDSRFLILDIDYKESLGVCWARNLIQSKYSGEEYTLQIDSHTRFVKNWDEKLIKMYKQLQKKGYKKPLITSYLPSFQPETYPKDRLDEVWKMDFNRFTPEGYIFTYPSLVEDWKKLNEPIPARFYSAHFSFTTGQFCKEVRHDPTMYFHGEEPSIAVRAFTWGYDLFHPHIIIGWHEYTRNNKKKHWDDDPKWGEKDFISHHRYRVLHEMDGTECTPCTKKAFGEYYFGENRSLQEYEAYAGIRFKDRSVQQYTLDFLYPPNPIYKSREEYDNSFISVFKHCLDIHRSHFNETDYDFWVVSFEMNDDTVVHREDVSDIEIINYLNEAERDDGWVRIWREYVGPRPDKWIVWPHSKSKGFVERLEQVLV